MSILDSQLEITTRGKIQRVVSPVSLYQPSDVIKERISLIRECFTYGDVIMKRPRREFNDLAFIERLAVDQMAWSVYQPNDGDALAGDFISSWRSNAVRPIVRNKVFSIAAHVTARNLFPKVMAFDKDSQEQSDAAQVMSDLMEYSTYNTTAEFAGVSLQAVISALVNPVSIVQTQYREVYRTVKRGKNSDGTWKTEQMLDEDLSGFQDESVPPEQFYIQDFYQNDVQKQGWIIRRRVRPYSICRTLYQKYEDFKYVKPGVQVLYDDANGQQFYDVYDSQMRQDECEEILYWNKSLDLLLIVVNGILMTDPENPNPREDKLYPFATFGYEQLRANGDSFYWKSLAFKTMPDDKIVNTLYPMIIDGTYLAIMPPMIAMGGEVIASDVIVPGGVTTFQSPDADLKPISVQNDNLKAGMDALFKVEQNITDDAFQPMMQGDTPEGAGNMTAYTMSKLEANAKLMMGPFVSMVGCYVKQMGRLRIGDIKQHITMPETMLLEGSANSDILYKTFILPSSKSRAHSHRIKFSLDMPDGDITGEEHLRHSYNVLDQEGGPDSKSRLSMVNPRLFRNLKYMVIVAPDVLQPMSDELEKAYGLEEYDRMVQAPNIFDPEETGKLLLSLYPATRKHPENYIAKAPPPGQMDPNMQQAPNGVEPTQKPQMTPSGMVSAPPQNSPLRARGQ